MPANCRPTKTSKNNVGMVHFQSQYRSPANRRQANDLTTILAPGEMFKPTLVFGVKKGNDTFGHWVNRFRDYALKLITRMTSQTQIFPCGLPSFIFRDDMVNDKTRPGIRHCRPAVSTIATRLGNDTLPKRFGNITAHSKSRKAGERGNPRHLRSRVAWAFLRVKRRASSPNAWSFSFSVEERFPRWFLVNKVLYARCFSGDNWVWASRFKASLSKDSNLSSSALISAGISSASGGTASARRSARNCSNGFRATIAPRRKRWSISSETWRVTV